jgi:hypothetical protein
MVRALENQRQVAAFKRLGDFSPARRGIVLNSYCVRRRDMKTLHYHFPWNSTRKNCPARLRLLYE